MRGPRSTGFILVLAAVVLAAVLAYAFQDRDDSLERLRRAGSLRIGYAVEPPYAYLDAQGGVTGEAPEIARRMAKTLGIEHIAWRQMEFGELIDALEAGQIDVIAAGMFITPERQRRVLFSIPTFHVRPGLLVARGNPMRIESYQQAGARQEVRIAVIAGAVEEQIMRRQGVTDARLLVTPDALTGRKAVESGLADALLLSEPTVRLMAQLEQLGRTQTLIAEPISGQDDIYGRTAYAFRLDAQQLRQAWDAALHNYLGSAAHSALLASFGMAGGMEQPAEAR